MKNNLKNFTLTLSLLIIAFSCSNTGEFDKNSAADIDDLNTRDFSKENISSSAAVENNQDTTHKFIRTADLKFKVKNVVTSTYDIENICNLHQGFVTYTELKSDIYSITTTAISIDSSLETTYFNVINTMILRVPNTKLDTTLKDIARNIDFLDSRVIKAQDVALSILGNELAQKRSQKHENRLENAIDNRGKKLNETTAAEHLLLSQQEQADNAKLANLSLNDQINFSTINLYIYQRSSIKRELVSNNKNIDAFEPSLASKIWDSLKSGWAMVAALLVFLAQFWAFYLLGIVGFVVYKKYSPKL